jgi:hypothetical protein
MRVTGQLHAPAALSCEKELPVAIHLQARWVPESAGHLEEKKVLLLPGIELRSLGCQTCSLVTVLSELSWLQTARIPVKGWAL